MIRDAVLPVIRAPESALLLDLQGWDRLIREARASNLGARIAEDLAGVTTADRLPAEVRPHLLGARRLAQRQQVATLAEVERVRAALADGGIRLVLLKGAAYLAAGLPVSRGRVFGDIDLLVSRAQLVEAESMLLKHGWISTHHDEYDQRYYREWMHELPPLHHVARESTLDLHHNILPSTARHPPDPALLLADAVETRAPGVFVLAPADMVLHSACHLFHEGELDNGLRDLVDLDGLLRHFGKDAAFWNRLDTRAEALHLEQPLRYALRMCELLLATPFPAALLAGRRAWPADLRERLLEQLYLRGLRPNHRLAGDRWTPPARWLLYVRGHWLRMPPHLLTAHLVRKAWRRWTGLEFRSEERDEAEVLKTKPRSEDRGLA
jgi:hypothetical protein